MFKQFYQRLNIALPKFLTALLIGLLLPPISGIVQTSFLPAATAAPTATATSTNTNLWMDVADSASAVANLATQGWQQITPSDIDDGFSEIVSNGQTCASSSAYCKVLTSSWSFKFAGKTYSKVFFSSNGYITFGGGSGSIVSTISGLNLPGLMLCAADRYVSRQLYLIDAQGNLRIRMEGYDFQSNFSTTPQIYEITLVNGTSELRVAVGKFVQGSTRPCNYPTAPTTPVASNTGVGLMYSETPTSTVSSLLQTFPTGKNIQYTSTIFTTSDGPQLASSSGGTVSTNVGVTRFDTITASGGNGAIRLTMNAANSGVTFDTSTGVGVVRINSNSVGTFTQTFTGTDTTGASTSLTVTYNVNALPSNTVSQSTLTTTLGRTGSETMTVTGGSGTKTFVKTSSFPQSGITIDTSSAASGIAVLKVAATGLVARTTTETITCTDAVGSVTVAVFTVVVNPVPTMTNSKGYTVPITVGRAMQETITVTGGTGTRTFVLSGTASSGKITIDTSTAASGYIYLNASSSLASSVNPYYETITVTDSKGASSTLGMKLVTTAVMVIGGGSTSTFNSTAGVDSYDTLTVTGGSIPNTFTVASTPSNSGFTVSSSSNSQVVIKVASTVSAGSYNVVVTGTDAAGATTTHTVTTTVSSPLRWSNSNASTLATTLGNAKNLQLDFVNGGSGKTFTMVQSALMTNPGITLDTTTILSNYVTLKVARTVGPGTYSVTVTGRDATGTQISSVITVTVNQPLSMTRNYNLLAIGLGSQKFNGTGQHLSLPSGNRWALGGTWTLEWWQYETGTATEKSVIKMAGNAFGVGMTATSLYLYNNSTYTTLTSSLVEADRKSKWTHFAIVSDSGTVYAYQNGIRLNATGINFGAVTTTYAPNSYAVCIGTKCGATDGTTASSTNYFGGYIANLMINKRIGYTGTSTTEANFTPGYNINVDSQTVVALVLLPGDSVLTDLSNNALTVTQRGNTAVGATDFPKVISPDSMVLETTQGKSRVSYSFSAEGGTGNKTMTSSADTVGLVTTTGSSGVLFQNLNESATAINSTTVRSVYETVTATDASGAVLTAKSKVIVNPQVAISATTFNLSVAAGVQAFDTITALYGTGSKSLSMKGSPATSSIEVFSNVPGNNATLVIRVAKSATVGTYYETITATDFMGDTETAVVTITVTPGLSLSSATGSTSISTTGGKATTLRIDAANGSGNKTFTLTETGRSSSGAIYLNNANANTGSGYTLLTIAETVTAGYTYSEKITVTDANGSTADITISVTVNSPQTISYKGATSGAIAIATTAGKAVTSDAFTAALGTGSRTLSITNLVTGVSIETSTANVGYLTLASTMTAGTYYETITATDEAGATTRRPITITVNPAISLSASFLSLTTTTGVAITDTVTATSGTGTKTFSLAVSPVVSGITFTNTVTDRAVITVGNTVGPGNYTITLTATDSVSATSSVNIALTVNSSLGILGSSTIVTTAGFSFTSPSYSATGGSGNPTFALTAAPGIRLSATTGSPSIIISDTVTASDYSLTLRVTDSLTATTTLAITLSVKAPVSLANLAPISKNYGVSGTYVFNTAVGTGTAPFTFSTTNICTTEKTVSGGVTTEKIMGVASCDWQVPSGVSALTGVLVVGGGGGGGWGGLGGGGGAGEVESSTAAISVTAGNRIAISVGAGGEDGYVNDGTSNNWKCGTSGSNSTFVVNGVTVTALGGGGGAGSVQHSCIATGKDGGSGGGGNTDGDGGVSTKPTQTGWLSYGNNGAGNTGGGGGAGGAGNPWSAADGSKGKGGAGITLMGMTFAGGGGAWNGGGATNGNETGGTGGGGRARGTASGWAFACNSCDGTSGTGSGGGAGGRGGSGFIAIQYATPSVAVSNTAFTFNSVAKTPTGQLQLVIPEYVQAGRYLSTIKVFQDAVTDNNVVSATYSLTIDVNKARPTLSLSIPGGGSTITYGSPVSLTATASTEGTITFLKSGSSISGCSSTSTSSGQAICSWTPTDTSTAVISATFTPNDLNNYETATATNLNLTVLQAETLTVTFNAQTLTYTGLAASISRAYTVSGLSSIDSITAVATTITGTANDSSSYSNTVSPTNAGTYSLTGTGVTFSGSTKASYYKGISFVPGAITINRAGNALTLNYGTSNTITYNPSGTETAAVTFLGDGSKNFESTNTSLCTVNSTSGALTTVEAGFCDVRLGISQGSNYLGDTITATVQIKRASRTITISSAANSLKYGETTTVTTLINNAPLDGLISYSYGSSTGCSYDSTANILTAISGTATCSITALVGIGTNYESATSTSISITLSKADAPVMTLTAPASVDYLPAATSSDMALPTFTITGLLLTDTATALSDMTITYVASGTYSYNSTIVPTGANAYTITPSALVLSTGYISNYQTPTYVGANWTINRIAQAALRATSLLQEGITVPYDIQYAGGSTNGSVSLSIATGGTATGCSTSGLNLRASSTGTCVIQLTMAGNQNYLDVTSETITVVIANFIQYIFNFDSLASGSSGITITSEVPITVDVFQCSSDCIPEITSLSATTFQAGDQIVITGVDFANATEVIFNRNAYVLKDNGMNVDSNTQITVVVPSGLALSSNGSIAVKSGNKLSTRLGGLTITG